MSVSNRNAEKSCNGKTQMELRNQCNETENVMREFAQTTVSCGVTLSGHLLRSACILRLTGVVEAKYTTQESAVLGEVMAFVRRKGNSYYLVHNVRHGEKVKQLHLARLGERARITDTVVREVSKKHPFVDLNWRALRGQLSQQVNLADPNSREVQKLIATLRTLHLDLADLIPPAVQISESPAVAKELLVQLRLLQSTIEVKLEQFGPGRGRLGAASLHARDARRRS